MRGLLAVLVLAAVGLAAPAALAVPAPGKEIVHFGLEHPCSGDLIDVAGELRRVVRTDGQGGVTATHSTLRATGKSVFGPLTYDIDQEITNDPLLVNAAPVFMTVQYLSIRVSDGSNYRASFSARYTKKHDGTFSVQVILSRQAGCAPRRRG